MCLKSKGLFAFIVFILFFLRAGAQGNDMLINIPAGEYPLLELIRKIEAHHIKFAYSADVIPNSVVKIGSNPDLITILKAIREQSGVKYSFNNQVVVLSYNSLYKTSGVSTIRGTIRDRQSGEVLIGASIYVSGTATGVTSNQYGFYSLTLQKGTYAVTVSHIGYRPVTDTILVDKNKILNFHLAPAISELREITISSRESEYNIKSLIPGVNTLNLKTEGQIPYFLGEVDVLQGALLLPGIHTIGEDASGINVRGGSVDQNLILLDEAVVYNPNHFYGLISVFNPEAVNSIEIMKGFIPPSYGGRASSVITIHQKEGNDESFHVTGGIGLVSARLIAEGPIKKGKSSFIVSGRQSIADLSVLGNTSTGLRRSSANFQDLNAKFNWRANKKNTFYLSGYYGNDRNRTGLEAIRNWGNRNIIARWNHIFGPRLFANTTAVISEYNYKITDPQEAGSFIGRSRIIDYTGKSDIGLTLSPEHELNFGGNLILHRLKPGDRIPFDENASTNPLLLDSEHAIEAAAYISHKAKFTSKLSAWYGLRYSSLLNIGPGEVYVYEKGLPKSDATIADTIRYTGRNIIKAYDGLEPRISLNYTFSPRHSLKASYSRSYQYIHLISNTVTPSPTDIWKISDTYIPPVRSDHYSLGYYRNFANNEWETSLEVYYKLLDDIIEYKNGAELLFNPNPETELLTGIGRSYGAELFLKKNGGRLTGWLSYTLSRSEKKVVGPTDEESINDGRFYPTNHDKKHDISLVGIYKINQRLSASASFNYITGRPVTLPVSKYLFEGNLVPHFENRNQSRLPDYHRLDISVKLDGRKVKKNGDLKKFTHYWTFVIYNVYGRKNIYSYFFRNSAANPGNAEIVPYTIFDTPVPAITYNFRF